MGAASFVCIWYIGHECTIHTKKVGWELYKSFTGKMSYKEFVKKLFIERKVIRFDNGELLLFSVSPITYSPYRNLECVEEAADLEVPENKFGS